MNHEIAPARNVFDKPLQACSTQPLTGFFRDGACNTADFDYGVHSVCAVMTQEFLEFSRFRGNNLMTPIPEANFPGLKSGDCWCLCASRWLEALEHNLAPNVYLQRTHKRTLELISLEQLKPYALDWITIDVNETQATKPPL
jgi:uncharacterized protein (DUF2237 family)